MAKIVKHKTMGTIEIRIDVDDGVAVLTTNNFRVTRQMFDSNKAQGKPNIFYNIKENAMIEKFEGLTAEEISARLDKDFFEADTQQAKASKYARMKQK